MAASAEIFFEHERWGRNLAWSAGFHVAIAVCIIGYAVVVHSGRRDLGYWAVEATRWASRW